ncbi:DUF3106 domain-containing protein [Undibacterium sp. Ji22W]|uniref:DUF3106 domain-containing protein n=1 Tax=Undibacterium sp. Ji22W TaxID=3413038 RepID=UPI003BF0B5D3
MTNSAFAFQSPTQATPSSAPVAESNENNPVPSAAKLSPVLKSAQKVNSTNAVSGKTTWAQLSVEQKTALAPLAKEWDQMDALRQKKWLGVANKYTGMKPEEQQRVQERVETWGKMTPEQRMAVRENFANTSKKSPEQKSAQWQQYQQLSESEKQKLANEAKVKKTITTIQPESKRTTPALAPLKKGPPSVNPASSSASQASMK